LRIKPQRLLPTRCQTPGGMPLPPEPTLSL
jgi:hypothetical protein